MATLSLPRFIICLSVQLLLPHWSQMSKLLLNQVVLHLKNINLKLILALNLCLLPPLSLLHFLLPFLVKVSVLVSTKLRRRRKGRRQRSQIISGENKQPFSLLELVCQILIKLNPLYVM